MTEEIIKECEFYLPLSENCNEILDDCGNEIYKCSRRQDCYYKQLKRLEQENKELLKYETYYLDKYIELRDSLEEIKEIAEPRFVNGLNEEADQYNQCMDRIQDKINEVLNDN